MISRKNSIKIEKELKTFCNKNILEEFMTIKSALQMILEGIIQSVEKDKHTQENIDNKKNDRTGSQKRLEN